MQDVQTTLHDLKHEVTKANQPSMNRNARRATKSRLRKLQKRIAKLPEYEADHGQDTEEQQLTLGNDVIYFPGPSQNPIEEPITPK